MKQKTIKQTLTTLCILTYLTLSAQVIDRFPHVESFEGSGNYSWGPVCPVPTGCGGFGTNLRFTLSDDSSMIRVDGDQFVQTYQVNGDDNLFVLESPIYDFTCLSDAQIAFWFACNENQSLNLEISLDGGATWLTELWNNLNLTETTILTSADIDLSTYVGNETVAFRFTSDEISAVDNIKVGPVGNSINLTYSYDDAGNRTGSTITVELDGDDNSIENREDESDQPIISNDFKFDIFPNPTSELVVIESNYNQHTQLEMYNQTGEKLLERVFTNNHKVDLSKFQNGIYYLHIFDNDQKVVYKVIKVAN